MEKQFFFIAGLPRSGSTLLVNILNQNKKFYASPTSGVLQIIKPIFTGWDNISEFKANANEQNKKDVLKGVLDSYYSQNDVEVVFDKCRGWPAEIEMLEWAFGAKPKIIMTVRDVRDILADWEKMYRRDKAQGKSTPGEQNNPAAFTTIASRCDFWASKESPLGAAFNVMQDAANRGFNDQMYVFDYGKWASKPKEEFEKLYKWLGIEIFIHNFENVKQVVHEKDEYYGYNDLHSIKEGPVLQPESIYQNYLTPEVAKKYETSNTWMR